MSVKRAGLGRNLSALLGSTDKTSLPQHDIVSTHPSPHTLSIDQLQPGQYQPRANMAPEALHELAESIKKQGLLQPIIVRALSSGQYEIIAGERRWRACQLAEMQHIPVIIRQVDDETAMAMALIENLQREDLNAMDQARAMYRLTQEFSLTHQQIAELLSKSRAAVSNYLRLLQLHPDVRRMLENGDLDMGHARCLLMLDEVQQVQIAHVIIAQDLSVREAEALVARAKKGPSLTQPSANITPIFQTELKTLSHYLSTTVQLKQSKTGKGALMISYDDAQELEQLMAQLLAMTPC